MPEKQMVRGTTDDLLQRYVLRILAYERGKQSFEAFCKLAGTPGIPFVEDNASRVVLDLSTVEELQVNIALAQAMIDILALATAETPSDVISDLMFEAGRTLRNQFYAKYGYYPEKSTTPYIPVTVDGPQDHSAYFLKEYGHP